MFNEETHELYRNICHFIYVNNFEVVQKLLKEVDTNILVNHLYKYVGKDEMIKNKLLILNELYYRYKNNLLI